MKNLKRKAKKLLPFLMLPLALALSASRARTAVRLSPCEEQILIQATSPERSAGQDAGQPQRKCATCDLAIFICDGLEIHLTFSVARNVTNVSLG